MKIEIPNELVEQILDTLAPEQRTVVSGFICQGARLLLGIRLRYPRTTKEHRLMPLLIDQLGHARLALGYGTEGMISCRAEVYRDLIGVEYPQAVEWVKRHFEHEGEGAPIINDSK